MIAHTPPVARRLLFALAALVLFGASQLGVPASAGARSVEFHGRAVQVPRGWPVYRLAQHPGMCVRLDRRAVYLGRPSPDQHCPADLIGRRRAILVEPDRPAPAGASSAPTPLARPATAARAAAFTGLGFDACSAPSSRSMKAWLSSPYRAVGVYIGGINRACSQPNLTSSWVAAQTEAGWHLLPLYVGLQAPTSECGSCAKLSSSRAAAQGVEAALDAVAEAEAVAIGPGSPIYFDMEAYERGSSASSATLAFLQAWTKKLHGLGYDAGVYSSSASGVVDLASKVGSSYVLPDELWIANWNGQKNTSDPNVPAGAWTPHHRVHQYRGGHEETYGGVTIDLDDNYVDAATVGSAALAGAEDPLGRIEAVESPGPGQVRVAGWAYDPSAPTEPVEVSAYVGGHAGAQGALEYGLGPALLPRPEVAAKHKVAGAAHGFEASFPTIRSGRQQVCLYASNLGSGSDRLLGCRTIGIPLAISLSGVRASAGGVRVRVACEWPAGSSCAGRLLLRAHIRVALHRRGRPVRLRSVRRSLANRGFRLGGGQSHLFFVPLSGAGRALLRERGHLTAQLTAAMFGGRRGASVGLGH